ncbi:MAG: PASTA domain-containing protein, partial [Desulfobacteraceae bacterium]
MLVKINSNINYFRLWRSLFVKPLNYLLIWLVILIGLPSPAYCLEQIFSMPKVTNKRLEEAVVALKSRGLVVQVTPGDKTDLSYKSSIVYRQSPKPGAMANKGDKAQLWAYQSSKWTKPAVSIPSVLNLEVETAKKMISKAGLKLGSIQFWPGNKEKMDGRVVVQYPLEYLLAEKGSRVDLMVYEYDPSLPKNLVVPNVVNLDKQSAESSLKKAGFKKIKTHSRAIKTPRPEQDGKIARQSPRAGAKIMNDKPITLYVYQYVKPAPMVNVPNVVGKQNKEAVRILLGLGLRPIVQVPPHGRPRNDNPDAEVVVQIPPAGTNVKPGHKIRLSLKPAMTDILPGIALAKHRVTPGSLVMVRYSIPPESARLGWLRVCPWDDLACRSTVGQKSAKPL